MKKSDLLNKLQSHVLYLRDLLSEAISDTITSAMKFFYILADIDRYNAKIVKLQILLGLPVSIIDTSS